MLQMLQFVYTHTLKAVCVGVCWSFVWTCRTLRGTLPQDTFPEKSSKIGEIKAASVHSVELQEAGREGRASERIRNVRLCMRVCLCVCAWEAAGVASITSLRPHPPVQGIAWLLSPSNPLPWLLTTKPQSCCFPNQWVLVRCACSWWERHNQSKAEETNTGGERSVPPEFCTESKDKPP